jgi:branched-chain amino acid transport system permease protein
VTHHGLPILFVPILSIVGIFAFSVLICLPVRRMTQEYWALVTFSAQELFRQFMLNEKWVANGAMGVSNIPRLIEPAALYLGVAILFLGIAFGVAQLTRYSPFGRTIRIIREDELLAASLGRSVFRYQLTMTVMGGLMAAAAGVLYAHYTSFVNPDAFMPVETFTIWIMLILGGAGNSVGAIVGALILQSLTTSSRFIAQYTGLSGELVAYIRIIGFNTLLVLLIMYRPQGIFPEKRIRHHAPH